MADFDMNDIKQKIGETVGDVKENAGNILGDVKESAGDVFGNVKENAGNILGDIKEEASEVLEEAKAAASGQKLESSTVGAAGYREAQTEENKGLATAALVLGIVSIIGAFVSTWVGLIAGVIGVILGAKARKQSQTSMATAGFVCSIVGVALSALLLVCALACVGSLAALSRGM